MNKEDKKQERKDNTINTMIDLTGYFFDAIVQLVLFIPRIAIRFIQGLLS